jgi:hypothetical protein
MTPLVLQHNVEPFEGTCALCNKSIVLDPGLQLCRPDRKRPVCSACGRRAAPALTALQQLADAADRVGRMHSYTVMPPLTALLELARAAESFADRTCVPVRS